MRKASVTIGTLLVVGAAVALVNCGGDDSSPTGGTGGSGGSGAAGGTGGTTGGAGGKGGAAGGTAGTGGSSGGGMPDGSATGGSSGAAGCAGKGGNSGAAGNAGAAGRAGSSGAAGAGGSAGSAGAAGAAGSAGKDGGAAGSAGTGMDASPDGGQCPATPPAPGGDCDVIEDCLYGPVTCTCLSPGAMGSWACSGGPSDGGNTDTGGLCPAAEPSFGDPCADAGFLGPCLYDSGHSECVCDPAAGWGCIRH
ncbi:MAG TPA: hypothetical protein VK550_09020 [Polyangiaceae bacterium]|nr:hypothetical protein [Polyangiaceae bacterium]